MGFLMAEHLGSQEMWQAFFCRLRVAIPPLTHQHPSHHHIPVMHPKSIARACGAALSLAEKHQRELRSLCLRGHTFTYADGGFVVWSPEAEDGHPCREVPQKDESEEKEARSSK